MVVKMVACLVRETVALTVAKMVCMKEFQSVELMGLRKDLKSESS